MTTQTFRGSITYHRVFAELVRAAEYQGLTTYQDVAMLMGIAPRGSFMGTVVGRIFTEICEDEVRARRPMLSAVGVSVEGRPGPGFFELARKLGRVRDGEDDETFWRRELADVHRTWKRPIAKGPTAAKTDKVVS